MADKKHKAAEDKDVAVDSFNTPIDTEAQGGEAFVVQSDPTILNAPDADVIEPVVEDQVPVEVAPDQGDEIGQGVALPPSSAGGPISTRALPNAHRDAAAIAIENGVILEDREVFGAAGRPAPLDIDESKGDAYFLAKLLERFPEWVNNLDQLDDLMKAAGLEPHAFGTDPQDLLEEAKRYNFYFIGANGNFLTRQA